MFELWYSSNNIFGEKILAFNKKKKRKITINSETYFWSATGNDGWISLHAMTETPSSPRLSCSFGYHQIPVKATLNGMEIARLNNQFVITPFIVRKVIEYALAQDWTPFEKGKDLVLGSINDKIDINFWTGTMVEESKSQVRNPKSYERYTRWKRLTASNI